MCIFVFVEERHVASEPQGGRAIGSSHRGLCAVEAFGQTGHDRSRHTAWWFCDGVTRGTCATRQNAIVNIIFFISIGMK